MLPEIVLASSSPYRRHLLAKLGLNFIAQAPAIDETPGTDERPEQLATRLSRDKAKALQERYSRHCIIGSDQVAMHGNKRLPKPGNRENAIQQLREFSAGCVTFYTGICVLNSATGSVKKDLDICRVYFKHLTESSISNYVDREKPFDCAASFKSEALGIVLVDRIVADDPNALVGLPLIRLTKLLEKFGIALL